MPWWLWLVVISLSITVAYGLIMTLITLGPIVKEKLRRVKYSRDAKQHNERARLLRLERTQWMGYPLPTGKEGTLRITYHEMVINPHRFNTSEFERVYFDRARDMGVELEYMNDPITRDVVIRWKPDTRKKPKEVY